MFNRAAYQNTRSDGIPVLEITEIPREVRNEDPERSEDSHGARTPRLFVPLKRTELRGEVIGPLAQLVLQQVYGYSADQCGQTLEAVYRFPLPGDAAVTGVRVSFGDTVIEAELKDREQSEADYQAAKEQGQQAALATRESPDVFTLQVAGLQPDQEISVETSYVQLARVEGKGWSLRTPLTTAPRYVRSDEVESRHAQGQPLAVLRDPGHRFSLNLTIHGAAEIGSPTHQLQISEDRDASRVRLMQGEILPDRDFVLTWQPRQQSGRPTLEVILHQDADSGFLYFLALAAPPAHPSTSDLASREVVLLVDHSSSMFGAKWEAADWTVKNFLSDLGEKDLFDLCLFHNSTRWFDKRLQNGSAANVAKALTFLEKHQDMGGTELGVALEQGLDLKREPGDRARHLLIVTDAEVTDSGRILRLADEESRRLDRRRISVICVDAAPNSFLATELAERGAGAARFLTSSPEEDDITTALDEILMDWAAPVLTNLRLLVSTDQLQATGRETMPAGETGWSAIDLGDLPAGRAIWITGRIPLKTRGSGAGSGDVRFRLTSGKRDVASCRVGLGGEEYSHPAVKALFGARRVLGLEFLMTSGYAGKELREGLDRLGYDSKKELAAQPPMTRRKVYAENERRDAKDLLRGLLVREALHYGLASAETAFVTVRHEAGRQIEGTIAIANALPQGWSGEFAGLRSRGGPVVVAQSAVSNLPAAMPAALARSGSTIFNRLAEPTPSTNRDAGRSYRQSASAAASRADLSVSAAPSPMAAEASAPGRAILFAGTPQFQDGQAVLFDSARTEDSGRLPGLLSRLEVRFLEGQPAGIDDGLTLQIFVDDLSQPRARVKLKDLVQSGVRPLNIQRMPGQVVRLVLVDPNGAFASGAPAMEVCVE